MLGTTWNASVDLTTTGSVAAVILGYFSPEEIFLGGGQTLLVGGIDVFVSPGLPGPIASWSLPIPNLCALHGVPISTQAVLIGPTDFALSNAQDLVFGS